MAVITTSNHPKDLWPGIKAHFGHKYAEHPQQWKEIFEEMTSDKAYEEIQETTGFGTAPIKPQGQAITYDSTLQGYTARFTHVAYALGYIVSHEELKDNQYEAVSKSRASGLAFSMRQSKELVHANIINNAYTSGTGGDGVYLCSASHPTRSGNQSNLLTTAADLSEASIEDLLIQIMGAKNNRDHQIRLMGEKLLVHRNNWFEAHRILKSVLQNDTANNAVNAIKATNALPGGIVMNHYLTDTNAWGICTNAENGLISFTREALSFDKDNDFGTKNALAAAYERYSCGWGDWRGFYGTPGA